jgi:transcriptional regulator with XRE-family HTH domain
MVDERKTGDAGGRHRTVDRRIGDFGSRLREARERKGVSLREIANATKISVRALEALEKNDISHLPGGIFSRSFVRAYAAEAGLDPDEAVDDFVRQFPHDSVIAGHAASSVHVDDTEDESNRRTARVVLRLIVLSVPVAALVLYFGLASRRAPSVEAEPVTASAGGTETIARRLGVEVTARRACLLTAGVDGQPLVDTPLEAGGRQSFNAETELTLTVSDPSAIEIMINGLRGRSLGAEGIMTTVRLTPDNYKNFVANQ